MYPQYVASWDYNTRAKKSSKEGAWTGPVKDYDNKVLRPCGKCPDCLRKRAIQWCFRLQQEQKYSISSYFLTLTYNNDNLPIHLGTPTLKKDDLKKFLHTMRSRTKRIHSAKKQPDFQHYGKRQELAEQAYQAHKGVPLKYYAIGEYGTKLDRPHYHAIAYNIPRPLIEKLPEIWEKGHVKVGTVTPKSIRYVSNYIMHLNSVEEKQKEFATMSNGLGVGYLHDNEAVHRKQIDATVTYNDHKVPMPEYYRSKIYTSEERHYQAEKNEKESVQREVELAKELHAKGLTFEEYQQQLNQAKWRKYFKNKKYKR